MLALYFIPLLIIIILLLWFIYRKQWQNLVRPLRYYAEVSGAPHYVAGSTSGSPLSELGSHCGFKAVVENKSAARSALFGATTSFGSGRILDFAACLHADDGNTYFRAAESRKIHTRPYKIEEHARDRNFSLSSSLYFLQTNLAVLEIEWQTVMERPVKVRPAFVLINIRGKDLENPYPHITGFTFLKEDNGGILMSDYYRYPRQKYFARFTPSSGGSAGKKTLLGPWMELKPGEKISWSVVISFSADGAKKTALRAERALRNLESLRAGAVKRWAQFERMLPIPYDARSEKSESVLKLAAWALQNSLYYPRGKMRYWGSVPAKVYFPFFWGWDTPQHVLGISEWNPGKAGDLLLTQLDGNNYAPSKARFNLKVKGISIIAGAQRNLIPSKLNDELRGVLDFYSQPPLQSWAAVRVYERFRDPDKKEQFVRRVLPLLQENLKWWEENRRLKNGLFSYLNGLESGLDDSPRFYPPSFLPSFIIGLIPRFFGAVDLNCWIFQSYLNLAYLCNKANCEEDAAKYLLKSFALKERIDEELWSDEHQAWLDIRNGKYIEVITPSIWWPAFVGATMSLNKVRAVIENHLLNADQFWGEYGIPSVAFDDASYNARKDGYYWRGQIWMINNYAALEVLFRFGYEKEAARLHQKIIDTAYASQGLYETYNASTGAVGWSSRGPGDPAVMQFGMSSGWATQIIFYRYQHFRYLFPHTMEISGHIQWAATFDQAPTLSPPSVELAPREAVLQVHVPGGHKYDVPKVSLKSGDGKPLLRSSLILISCEDTCHFVSDHRQVTLVWQGESYRIRPDRNYRLRPFAASDKLTVAE